MRCSKVIFPSGKILLSTVTLYKLFMTKRALVFPRNKRKPSTFQCHHEEVAHDTIFLQRKIHRFSRTGVLNCK